MSTYGKKKEAVLPVRVTGKKNDLIKRTDSDSDNMNCDRYMFSAKFSKTGKIRTKQKVVIFKGDDLHQEIKKLGFEEPIEITSTKWDPPTDAQIQYLKNIGLLNQATGICKTDANCILSTYETGFGIAPQDLYLYATNHRIVTSFYAPEDYLYENIWSTLKDREKIAFFIFCVYRDRVHHEDANLDALPEKNIIYEIADCKIGSLSSFLQLCCKDGNGYRYQHTRLRNQVPVSCQTHIPP